MEERFKEVKGKILNIEAKDVDLQRKIDAEYAQLEGKIDAGEVTELRKNLSFAIPNYDTFVESKYVIHI